MYRTIFLISLQNQRYDDRDMATVLTYSIRRIHRLSGRNIVRRFIFFTAIKVIKDESYQIISYVTLVRI